MSENKEVISKSEIGGSISYSEDVIAIISGLAATEVEGVVGMSGGLKSGIGELLGRKDLSKGIKATVTGEEAVIEANIIIKYGCVLSDVALAVQKGIKRAVEGMSGLQVTSVNVNVLGVQVDAQEQ